MESGLGLVVDALGGLVWSVLLNGQLASLDQWGCECAHR
jgi:hypothetical protein